MSKPKGMIIIELPEVPKNCHCCSQVNEYGYCCHVGKYVDHYAKIEKRSPLCPIVPMKKACETDKAVVQLKEHAIEILKGSAE